MRGRILGATLVMLLLPLLAAACGGEKPVIRLHDPQDEGQWVNNAIAEFIIEEGYGYPVEVVVETTPIMQTALPKGEIDLNLEGWQQNIIDWYDEQIAKGTIVNLGMTFEGGPQFFLIPRWAAEEHNIKTVFDMKDHWELFKDPEDPSKGVFYNCITGWQCAEINTVKMEAYGLTSYYNLVSPGSSAALQAALERPQQRHQAVFGYYWAPTALVGAYDWYILEEPPYNVACWEKITAAREDRSLRPIDQACAYETLPIDKLAHSGLRQKAPDVVEMLEKMNVGLDPSMRRWPGPMRTKSRIGTRRLSTTCRTTKTGGRPGWSGRPTRRSRPPWRRPSSRELVRVLLQEPQSEDGPHRLDPYRPCARRRGDHSPLRLRAGGPRYRPAAGQRACTDNGRPAV